MSSAEPVLALGIDVGTTNSKVVLVAIGPATDDPAVRTVATAAAPTAAQPAGGVASLLVLVRSVLAAAGRPPDVVGIASMAETGVPLDDAGRPLRPWLRWDGHRGSADAAALAATLGSAALFDATGVRASAKVPLATWSWLQREEPQVWDRMHRWAGVADFVCLAMTGRLVTDHTLAGRTMGYRLAGDDGGLPPAFDHDLLAAVGLSADRLPEIVRPGDPAGRVEASAFVDAGLVRGTPVVVCGHDHAVGAYAAGIRGPGQVADSVGTTEAIMAVLDAAPVPRGVAAAGMSVVRTVGGRHLGLLAGSASAGAMVAWWLETYADGRPSAEVFAEIAEIPAEPTGVLVLPYLSGRQAPAPDAAARAQVIGATDRHGRAQLTRALLEGLALQARWMLAEIDRLADVGPRQREIAVLGGAVSANPAWMTIKTDVSTSPLRLVTTAEPVACGAALLAAERAGLVEDAPVLPGRTVTPSAPGAYDRMFADFVAAATSTSGSVAAGPARDGE